MSRQTLMQTNGSVASIEPWLRLSVQQFFSEFNWDNLPPVALRLAGPDGQMSDSDQSLSMMLKVNQFFGAIAWDGARVIAAPPAIHAPSPPATEADRFTLEDFSDLF
jgi:hypothetical protein